MMIAIGFLAETPLGGIWTAVSAQGLVAVSLWPDEARFIAEVSRLTGQEPIWQEAAVAGAQQQLQQFLQGERQSFDLDVDWSVMTPFQQRVLRAVTAVGYGQVTTYQDIANQIDNRKGVRAVGRANATNPMPIVIPCHRVLGRDGQLHGYSAPEGLETKAWLLRLEGSWLL